MRLASCGISLDVTDGRLKQTTLHLAAFAGNALVLDWILHAGASIEKQVSIWDIDQMRYCFVQWIIQVKLLSWYDPYCLF